MLVPLIRTALRKLRSCSFFCLTLPQFEVVRFFLTNPPAICGRVAVKPPFRRRHAGRADRAPKRRTPCGPVPHDGDR